MEATEAEREAKAGMMIVASPDGIGLLMIATVEQVVTSTEVGLVADLARNLLWMIVIIDLEQTEDLDVRAETETKTEREIVVTDLGSEGGRQVRRSVLKARLQSHNLLKTNVIGGLSSYNSLLHGSEPKSSSNFSKRLDLSRKLRSSKTVSADARKGMYWLLTKENLANSFSVGYVEFKQEESVQLAIQLTGQKLLGIPIIAQLTEAEKNRQARNPEATSGNHNSIPFHRLYVGNIHFSITESDLQNVFEPFGELEFVQLQKEEMGRSRGYGFVQ